MRIILWLLSMACCAMTAMAAPVTKSKAVREVQSFMDEKGMQAEGPLRVVYESPLKCSDTPCYYVVSNGDDNGFVIVSGDDRTERILGYSTTGGFDSETLPAHLQEWLKGYCDQMQYLEALDISSASPSHAPRHAVPTTRPIQPLLESHWSQLAPYNNLCPTSGNAKTLSGCVAMSLAMVMHYYQYPSATLTSIPRYANDDPTVSPVVQPSVPSGTTFDWDHMLNTYRGGESNEEELAVATLSRVCGLSVKTIYGTSFSTANMESLQDALTTYFGYDRNITYKKKCFFTNDEWTQLLYSELSSGRPVIYRAVSGTNAHAFVIDGCDGDDLFHINWGWNDGTDGYFRLDILCHDDAGGATVSSTGYTMDHGMVIGIQPASGAQVSSDNRLSCIINDVAGTAITCTFKNSLGVTHPFFCALGIKDKDGKMVPATSLFYTVLTPGTSITKTLAVDLLTPGRYRLVPICKEYSTEAEWVEAEHDAHYVECTVSSTGMTTLSLLPKQCLEATVSFGSPCLAGVEQPVNISLYNPGEEYCGILYLFASKTTAKGEAADQVGVSLVRGKSVDAKMWFTPEEAGTYHVWVATDSDGTEVLATTNVTIAESSHTSEQLLTVGIHLDNSSDNCVYGTTLHGVVRLSNPSEDIWVGEPYVIFFHNTQPTGSFTGEYWFNTPVTILPGGSVDIPFNHIGVMGDYYRVAMRYQLSGRTAKSTATFQTVPGFVAYNADGSVSAAGAGGDIVVPENALAVDFTGVDDVISSVTPNSNPNTLYYFSEGATIPQGLEDDHDNLVVGGKASRINLVDGYDFQVPMAFVASEISYSRIPSLLTDGNGYWETIALPFDVAEITLNGHPIDFFHSADDSGKDFWVRYFSAYEGANLFFGFTDRMEANVPYLVAFPGDKWGKRYSFEGKTVCFIGKDAKVYANALITSGSEYYSYTGTTTNTKASRAYILNDTGKWFSLSDDVSVAPFRAYIKPKFDSAALSNTLHIFNEEVTGVRETVMEDAGTDASPCYNLSGQRVSETSRGLVVKRGRKYVK